MQRIPYPDLHAEEEAEADEKADDEAAFSNGKIKQVS